MSRIYASILDSRWPLPWIAAAEVLASWVMSVTHQVQSDRQIEILSGRPQRVINWIAEAFAIMGCRANENRMTSQFGHALQFAYPELRIAQGQMSCRKQPVLVRGAKLESPRVVGAAER